MEGPSGELGVPAEDWAPCGGLRSLVCVGAEVVPRGSLYGIWDAYGGVYGIWGATGIWGAPGSPEGP